MNTSGIVAKFKKERKKLVRDLAKIDAVLAALGHSALNAYGKGRKPQKHTAKSRKAIARAKKKWWADRKKSGKV